MTDLQLQWQKSSFSGGGGEQCVEVAAHAGAIHIRESDAPALVISSDRRRFAALLAKVKAGAFRC